MLVERITFMQKEIGSIWDLNPDVHIADSLKIELGHYGIMGTDSVLLSTGRSSLNFVLDAIEERGEALNKRAFIPAFTCDTVINPFLRHGYELFTYPIDNMLIADINVFRNMVLKSGATVCLVHRYFGFDTLPDFKSVVAELSGKGIIFIEDCTQSLYGDFEDLSADYIIGSLRKWAALPDGGYAVCRYGKFSNKPQNYNLDLKKAKLDAYHLKYLYLYKNKGDVQGYQQMARYAEAILDSAKNYYMISPESEYIQSHLDLNELKRKRRSNYEYLYEKLCDFKDIQVLTPKLCDADVPFYLAVVTNNREKLQQYLVKNYIFASVIWSKSNLLSEIYHEVQYIYDNILCFPIDQRYDIDDMERMTACLKKFYGI